VSELFPPAVGGSAVLFDGIYSRLIGAEVVVLTDGPADDGARPERRGALTVLRRPLAARGWGIADPKSLRQHLRVARQLRDLTSDEQTVVHCGRALPEGVAALIAHKCGGAPYVCWAHGEDIASALTSRELIWLARRVYLGASATLANSRNTGAMLAALGVPESKIVVVHPAVDAKRFRADIDGRLVRRRFAGDTDVMLLSVGRLQRRKGHDVAIRAVASLREELPNLRYVIAGDGEERARLERLAADEHVADRVFFAGTVSAEELPAFYAACDVFVLPNRVDEDGDLEGFGIVFLEAAASGKPVIGGDSGGVPEAVERDVTGLLVDGANVAAVSAAIQHLATSEPCRRRLGTAGRARVERCFSWDRAAHTISDVQLRVAVHP
jgi:phosphatidylinositol alpha-1,6-mannosyltransferase